MSKKVVRSDELEAAIEARKELGAEKEPALVDAFVERIERRLAAGAHESERALKRATTSGNWCSAGWPWRSRCLPWRGSSPASPA